MDAWRLPFGGLALATFILLGPCSVARSATAPDPKASPAELATRLAARYVNEADLLIGSPFGRPISLNSGARDGLARAEALAEVALAMPVLREVLVGPPRWCEILLLTPHVAGCTAPGDALEGRLEAKILRRYDQPGDEAAHAAVSFHRAVSSERYLALRLTVAGGPLGTRDHRLEIDVAPLDERRSVLRAAYSYRYGPRAATTLGLYWATAGRDRLGFGTDAQGRPVRDLRGAVERDVMRYLLAVESNAVQPARDAPRRHPASLDRWLDAVDLYPERIAVVHRDRYRRIKLEQLAALRSAQHPGHSSR